MPKRLPGHGRSIIDDLRDERLVVGLILTVVVTAAVTVQAPFFGFLARGAVVLPLLQGPAIAIYGFVLAMCIDPRRGWIPGGLLVVLGATQPAWFFGFLMLLNATGVRSAGMPDALWECLPFAMAGAVFVLPAWWATRRWWGAVAMLLTTATASGLAGWGPPELLGVTAHGMAVAILHMGLAWTLCAAVIERTWRIVPAPANHCLGCGYPREGLTTNVCPECGAAFPTP